MDSKRNVKRGILYVLSMPQKKKKIYSCTDEVTILLLPTDGRCALFRYKVSLHHCSQPLSRR